MTNAGPTPGSSPANTNQKIMANNEDTNQKNESAFIAEARALYYMLNAEERAAFLAQLAKTRRAVRRPPRERTQHA
jgi:hypothetical protein